MSLQLIRSSDNRRLNLRVCELEMICSDLTSRYGSGIILLVMSTRAHFYQTRSAWSVDQGSNKNHSPAYNFAPTVTKFCVMWEGLSLPHDTKFGNCRCKVVDSRAFPLLILDPWITLIRFDKSRARATCLSLYKYDRQSKCNNIFVWGSFLWYLSNSTETDGYIANWKRHNYVKRRFYGVIMTLLLRHVPGRKAWS